MIEYLNDRDDAKLKSGFCLDCNSQALVAGPMGGLAQNVKCSNCGSEFNVSPVRSHRLPIKEPS